MRRAVQLFDAIIIGVIGNLFCHQLITPFQLVGNVACNMRATPSANICARMNADRRVWQEVFIYTIGTVALQCPR